MHLRKTIVKRLELKIKYLKNGALEHLKLYKKQRNVWSKFKWKMRKKYYADLNLDNIK